MRIQIFSIILISILFSFAPSGNSFGKDTHQNAFPTNNQEENKRFITIDFDDVDIQLFIKYMSELTGKNFVIDKTVKGNVTIVSPTKISEEDAYRVFESVLEVHGFTAVPAGPVTKIIPIADAHTQNVDTLQMGMTDNPEDKIVTQLIQLKHGSPEEIKKALTPLLAKTSVIIADTKSGMLIVTDTLSNIQRLLSIIEALDVSTYSDEQITVLPMKNGSAVTAAKVINGIFTKSAAAKNPNSPQEVPRIVAYERINAIVVMGSDSDVPRIRKLVSLLDTEKEKGEGSIHVFYLQNANAKDLAKTLNAIPDDTASGEEKVKTEGGKDSKTKILADEETNSLIVNASLSEYGAMEEVIKKLDIPRRMVFLETLIMEVDTTKDFQVGVQWESGSSINGGAVVGGYSGNSTTPYDMINGLNSTTPSLPVGASFGILKEGIKIGSATFPNIAAIINAYKQDSDINIISTPQILTTDNKKAEIGVGENVPYITSKNTTSGTQQDYTNYEYKDVSTKLTITPHINQSDILRLELKTEVIKLKDNTTSLTPTTLKRTADTTVVLQDGETVVIGGIIGHDATEDKEKTPLLGDIPLVGWLFKNHSINATKTNMFIFVTPHIIKNTSDISQITHRKEAESGKGIPEVRKQLSGALDNEPSMKLFEMGYDKLQHNQIQEAKRYFLEALEKDPENFNALLYLAMIFEKEGQFEKAVGAYRKVVRSGTDQLVYGYGDQDKTGMPVTQIAQDSLERLHAGVPSSPGAKGYNE
ncbi:MAG: type II secretion system secretin GspD [Desulfocapsaceae bacterium]|nr:type II secretion system secretin GspD [Desulfocapsaceae bacterium]